MEPVATDAAHSMVCLSVCLSVCVAVWHSCELWTIY